MDIEAPVFLIGTGRSGSTLVARLISHQPDLSYLTYLSREFPHRPAFTGIAMRILTLPGGRQLLRSRGEINEAWEFWEQYARGFAEPMRDLTAADVTPFARANLARALAEVVAPARPRFFAKITGWSRMRYLYALFPDARFVHLVRDGRDVANSLLRVAFWNGRWGPSRWRFGPLNAEDDRTWRHHDRSFVALAGLAWKILTRSVEEAREVVPAEQFYQIRFEDFLGSPSPVLKGVFDFYDLSWSSVVERAIRETEFSNTTERYKNDLDEHQQEILYEVLADDLTRYGYL